MDEQKKGENPSEQNFDETELEDIMSEIESLEREVVKESSMSTMPEQSEGPVGSAPIDEEVEQTQQAPESQLESSESPSENDEDHHEDHEGEGPAIEFDENELAALEADCESEIDQDVDQGNVVALNKSSGPTFDGSSEGPSPVKVSASGDMNLELNFTVGDEQALLSIEQGQGLSVEMEGMSLYIDSERGCCISLPGGVEFTVPLNTGETSKYKKTG